MGHLINPISLRIGKFSYWEDIIFIPLTYFPEYLHILIKIRLILIFFFSSEILENFGFIFSHFEITKKSKFLVISTFLYNGILEQNLDEFLTTNFFNKKKFVTSLKLPRILSKISGYTRIPLWFDNFFRAFVLFKTLSPLRFTFSKYFLPFLGFMYKGDYAELWALLTRSKIEPRVKKNLIIFNFLFSSLFEHMLTMGFDTQSFTTASTCKRFLYLFIWKQYIGPFLNSIGNILCSIFKYIFKLDYLYMNIYSINNLHVTAKFLSRYMARKMSLGFSIKQLAYPIANELIRVGKCLSNIKIRLKKFPFRKYSKHRVIFNHVILKKIVYIINNLFRRAYGNLYLKSFTWLGLDFFSIFESIIDQEESSLFFFVVRKFFENKYFFNIFLNFDSSFYNKLFEDLPLAKNFKIFSNLKNFKCIFEKIYDYVFSNNSLTGLYSIFKKILIIDPYLGSLIFNFLRFNFFSSQYGHEKISRKVSKLGVKDSRLTRLRHKILGFKFNFLGRFSRKQRSASFCVQRGIVPLNTFAAKIEYGFYTIPLLNSAINVKVWICRNDIFNTNLNYSNWFFKAV